MITVLKYYNIYQYGSIIGEKVHKYNIIIQFSYTSAQRYAAKLAWPSGDSHTAMGMLSQLEMERMGRFYKTILYNDYVSVKWITATTSDTVNTLINCYIIVMNIIL